MQIRNYLLVFFMLLGGSLAAQKVGNIRFFKTVILKDTIVVDSLSIIPGSLEVKQGDLLLDSTNFRVDYANARIIFSNDSLTNDSIEIKYRVFPLLFTANQQLRDRNLMLRGSESGSKDPFLIERPVDNRASLFGLEGLQRSGSISRGITVGTNQDAVVSSSLNLQLSGKIAGGVEIVAAITDDNVPIQAEGNTQQLQEFDKVFIQLSAKEHKLIAGDFDVRSQDGYFMRYYKKGQGAFYQFDNSLVKNEKSVGIVKAQAGAAVSRGKFARQLFFGIESNQGPYRLRGAENEAFIVILSGSEQIYLDGVLLQRGQDRDYIIDYNTAEIRFTSRKFITKDSRIIAEFQYSDRNYARTMLTGGASFERSRLRTYVNMFSEQDSKNQPLQQDLSGEEKAILASVGDNLSQAFAVNEDSVEFNANEVLYAKIDTSVNSILYAGIYVYSTSPDSAKFRVSFSNVGVNNGNYIAVDGITNGRQYKWIAPVAGVRQGNYEPVILLISPKQRQMLAAGINYALKPNFKTGFEIATSKNDVNKFSKIDKANDAGIAVRLNFDQQEVTTKSDSLKWKLYSQLQIEIADRNFIPIENYRPVEFVRDWNTNQLTDSANEMISIAHVGIRHATRGDIRYGVRSYLRGTSYNGIMNLLNAQYFNNHWTIKTDASYLITSGTGIKSSYLRHRDELSRSIGSWTPGVRVDYERNEIFGNDNDSLTASSFSWRTGEAFLQRADTTKLPMKFSISRRYEDGIINGAFKLASIADVVSGGLSRNTAKTRLALQLNYRNLQVQDTVFKNLTSQESASGRIDYTLNAIKNAVQFNAFYEGGTGREPRQQYSYLEVPTGTGVYSWIDYNGDGITQLNEFEISNFKDQANYIRVFTPTDDYVKVVFNQLNAVLNFNPGALVTATDKPLWAKFALLSSIRFDNKVADFGGIENWNPLPREIADTLLLSAQSSNRHTLFFNRSDPKFGTDITYQDQQVRQLLSNGIEERTNFSWLANIRWNFIQSMGIQLAGESGEKASKAEAFNTRDYKIERYVFTPKLNFQPGAIYRIALSYRFEKKFNKQPEGLGERAEVQDAGFEWRYSSVKKGIITAKFNYVNINFNAESNSAIAYEMLEGLKQGSNFTWGLSVQRNLGNSLQISLNYEGRKPSDIKTIHTGSVQARAFF
jgi:hypothetical protein